MLYGSETWGTKDTGLQQLQRNDRAMIRWICGTKVRDETPSVSLLQKLGIVDIKAALSSRRLRWYGHVQRATSCIKAVTDLAIPGRAGASTGPTGFTSTSTYNICESEYESEYLIIT